jgi:hypothetical protein
MDRYSFINDSTFTHVQLSPLDHVGVPHLHITDDNKGGWEIGRMSNPF